MRTLDDLRRALADADTPAGVDVAAVRTRARRQRRRRTGTAIAATALTVATAVAIPAVLVRDRDPAPAGPAAPPAVALGPSDCPNTYPAVDAAPDPDQSRRLVPFTVDWAVLCDYRPPTPTSTRGQPLLASRVLSLALAKELVLRLEAGSVRPIDCRSTADQPLVLRVLGDAGQAVTLRIHPGRCGQVFDDHGQIRWGSPALGTWIQQQRRLVRPLLSCPRPERMPRDPGPVGPPDRLLPFTPTRLIICRYRTDGRVVLDDIIGIRQVDGPAAAELVRELDRRIIPAHRPRPRCLATVNIHRQHALIAVRGTRTATLTSLQTDCVASNGTAIAHPVSWFDLLAG